MTDPVIIDLNRYLDSMDREEEEAEAAELQLWNERIETALNILNCGRDDQTKARRIVAWIEQEIEEWQHENL